MRWTPWKSRSESARDLITIPVALWLILGCATVNAQDNVLFGPPTIPAVFNTSFVNPAYPQNITYGPPSFQVPSRQAFEYQLFNRLTVTGRFQPDDLAYLARLVVLETIAMFVDIRSDLANTTTGNRLQVDITSLGQASELFYEGVISTPLDLANLALANESYEAVEMTYRQVESTLGEFPGLATRAADHLRGVSRLMAMIGPVMQELESQLLATVPVPLDRSINLDSLKRKSQLLANDLVKLIVGVSKPMDIRAGNQGTLKDLEDLLDHVQRFQRTLSLEPSSIDLEASLHTLRRQFRRAEAIVIQALFARGIEEWVADSEGADERDF